MFLLLFHMISITEYALSIFPKVDGIVWRVCIALTCMSTLRQECAVQIMSLNVHNHLVHTYREYDDNNRIRQQVFIYTNILHISSYVHFYVHIDVFICVINTLYTYNLKYWICMYLYM
jgi:hypothetical protein